MSGGPRIGLLFPGQGSQAVGMGRDLHERYPQAREIYARASEALGFDLAHLSFEGPEEELRATRNTQPAILTHSVAVLELLAAEGLSPAVAAGHSLGEYSALVAAGALELEEALRLVRRRGELMYASGVERPGTMAAVLGLTAAEVEEVCRRAGEAGVVCPANYNEERQTVISGEVAAVERAMALAREAGARRVQRLEVSGAFHSPLMETAAEGLRQALDRAEFRRGRFPVVANVDARPRREPGEVRDALMRQLTAPVRWSETMQNMATGGEVEMLLEVGPGRVLGGIARRALPGIPSASVEDVSSLERWRERVSAGAGG